jgi:hypothetical protein
MKRKLNPDSARAIERLERNLENLSYFCKPRFIPVGGWASGWANPFITSLLFSLSSGIYGSWEFGYWPSHELLREIEDDVTVLAHRGHVREIAPVWKAFERLDRRLTKLLLKSRVDNLISRARAMLQTSESELNKVVREAKAGTAQARFSSGDMVMKPCKLDELLQADWQMASQRTMAQPVARWTVTIGHPMRKYFVSIAGRDLPWEDWREELRRLKQSERTRRCRLAKKTSSKSVTPF